MRLEVILSCVASVRLEVLADIGTDHAFIPIEAVKRKLVSKAIACDIASGPLEVGKKNVVREGLTGYIDFRLGDGLQPLKPGEADTIVIAGIGGMRIHAIIAGSLDKICNANLILQPQHDTCKLRRGLFDLGLKIYGEHLAKESDRFYEILCAAKSFDMPKLTERDFFLGSHTGELAPLFYLQQKQKIEKYIHRISDENEKERAHKELAWLS